MKPESEANQHQEKYVASMEGGAGNGPPKRTTRKIVKLEQAGTEPQARSAEQPFQALDSKPEIARGDEYIPGVRSPRMFVLPSAEEVAEDDRSLAEMKLELVQVKLQIEQKNSEFQALWGDVSPDRRFKNSDGKLVAEDDLSEEEKIAEGLVAPKKKGRLFGLLKNEEEEKQRLVFDDRARRKAAYESEASEHRASLNLIDNQRLELEHKLGQAERRRVFREDVVPEFSNYEHERMRKKELEFFKQYLGDELAFSETEVVAVVGDGGSKKEQLSGPEKIKHALSIDGADSAEVLTFRVSPIMERKLQSSGSDGTKEGPKQVLASPKLALTVSYPDGREERILYVHEGPFTDTSISRDSMNPPKPKASIVLKNGKLESRKFYS